MPWWWLNAHSTIVSSQTLMRLLSHTPFRINRLQQPITRQTQPGPRQAAASPHRTSDGSLWVIGGSDKQRQRSWKARAEWWEPEGGKCNAHLYFPRKRRKEKEKSFPQSNYPLDGISNEEGEKGHGLPEWRISFQATVIIAEDFSVLYSEECRSSPVQNCYCSFTFFPDKIPTVVYGSQSDLEQALCSKQPSIWLIAFGILECILDMLW